MAGETLDIVESMSIYNIIIAEKNCGKSKARTACDKPDYHCHKQRGCELSEMKVLEEKTSYGEGALAGDLMAPKSVRFNQRVKQRRLIIALCCNVSLLPWQVTTHVGWSGRTTQLPRQSQSYGTEARYPRKKHGSQVSGYPSYRVFASSCALAAEPSCPNVKRLPKFPPYGRKSATIKCVCQAWLRIVLTAP